MVNGVRKYPQSPDPRTPLWASYGGWHWRTQPWAWETARPFVGQWRYEGPWDPSGLGFDLPLSVLRGQGDGTENQFATWDSGDTVVEFPDGSSHVLRLLLGQTGEAVQFVQGFESKLYVDGDVWGTAFQPIYNDPGEYEYETLRHLYPSLLFSSGPHLIESPYFNPRPWNYQMPITSQYAVDPSMTLAQIQAVIESGQVHFLSGDYQYSDSINLSNVLVSASRQAFIKPLGVFPAIQMSGKVEGLLPAVYKTPTWTGLSSIAWDSDDVGIRCIEGEYYHVHIPWVHGFEVGLQISPTDAKHVSYSTFSLGQFFHCPASLVLYPRGAMGNAWATQCLFLGGNLAMGAAYPKLPGSACVVIAAEAGNYFPNGLYFLNTCTEGADNIEHRWWVRECNNSIIMQPRTEVAVQGDPDDVTFYFGANAGLNLVQLPYSDAHATIGGPGVANNRVLTWAQLASIVPVPPANTAS